MKTVRQIVIHGNSGIRPTGEVEVMAALTDDEVRLPRTIIPFDTRAHRESIESGYWPSVDAQVRAVAMQVRAEIDQHGPASLLYVGLDEVPTLVALAAYIGDEHRIDCRDYDRDSKRHAWPDEHGALLLETLGLPRESIEMAGDAVLRIELTYPVQSSHVDEAVPPMKRIAEIVIRPKDATPQPGRVRAQEDVETLRQTVRNALAELERMRPGTQTIHLFLAGPVSACLAVGQELRLRNGRRVQTYRHRSHKTPAQSPAIVLTPESNADVQAPLTTEDQATAAAARPAWDRALEEVRDHSERLKADGSWPECLAPALSQARPYLNDLAPIWSLVRSADAIAREDATEFRLDRTGRRWILPDRMLLAMQTAAGGDAAQVRRLARAFFWHEYLHEYQYLTEHTVAGIGGFANCLERLDYIADVYGTLHQIDYRLRQGEPTEGHEANIVRFMCESITEAIDAFWTFEPPAPVPTWQVRRLRRYFNWYWRREQIRNADSVSNAIALLCKQPVIEIVGPPLSTDSRRVYLDVARNHRPDLLEFAMVDEQGRLHRYPTSTTLPISELLEAFHQHDRNGIDKFFASLFDHARQRA